MKGLIKEYLFRFLSLVSGDLSTEASILMYHSVDHNASFFTVTPEMFELQMKYLKDNDFELVCLSELVRRLKTGNTISRCVCVTFDDGYLDNYLNAFPILKKLSIPATIFIATGYRGNLLPNSTGLSLQIMTDAEIREMMKTGIVEFMPHTRSHVVLSSITLKDAEQEIVFSRADIEVITGTIADIFAYPKGKYTHEHSNYLKKTGWSGAVTVKEGLVTRTSNCFELPRNSIDSTTTFSQFKGKLSHAIKYYGRLKGN